MPDALENPSHTDPPDTPEIPSAPAEDFQNIPEDRLLTVRAYLSLGCCRTSVEHAPFRRCVHMGNHLCPSFPCCPDPPDLAAIAAPFFQPMQDVPQPLSLTASSFLDTTLGSFFLSPGTHPCTSVSSFSLEVDASQAMPPFETTQLERPLGNGRPPVPKNCRGLTFQTSRA